MDATHRLAAAITRAASLQTHVTIQCLVDRGRVPDAFRAYAYFRWVDDRLDQGQITPSERLTFLTRQQALLENGYRGARPEDVSREECMLLELIRSDTEANSGLQLYLRQMMTVMAFDAERRGRLVSQAELNEYTHCLATAVTEALHYFIGHDSPPPRSEARYLAAAAAHITHMLRDTYEDTAAGYFNIPREQCEAGLGAAPDVDSVPYRAWVQSRVHLARAYFAAGRRYLARVESLRCRLAGYAYIARFEGLLDTIEQEGYRLRPEYSERKSPRGALSLVGSVLQSLSGPRAPRALPRALPVGPHSTRKP